ncbi:uncharacterized protein LOC107749041 [Sinocyclocheilus rhinocerous]|uniref:uncharacterized protein LOC107749041 n=1 Tax=Sinocyclocheilus rhinocerous TaxID=307959 RepID=UPI0007B88B0F|nr:PREDICTED: uncharacterized protein LOC107749041 [Sinocyclocheilus rhinocerous]
MIEESVCVSVSSSSSSSSQTEISAGRSVTLFCQLYSYPRGSCNDWISSERIELFWVNQAGVKLTRSDSRYQILFSSDHCIITLNTTLLNEDHNREWRCNVTQRDQVKSSVTYTVKSSAQTKTATAVIPVHSTNSQDPSTTNTHVTKAQADSPAEVTSTQDSDSTLIPFSSSNSETTSSRTTAAAPTQVIVIAVCASFALLLPALILWLMIRRKRAAVRRATDDSVEQTDDVTYTDVTVYRKNGAKKNEVRCDDKVTYASIRGTKAKAQDNCSQLYASVKKNHHKSDK